MSRKKMRNRFFGSRIHCGEDGDEDQVSSDQIFLEGLKFWERGGGLSFLSIFGRIGFSTMKRWKNREIQIQRDEE